MLACTFFWNRSVSSNRFFLKSETLIRLRTSTLDHFLPIALVTPHHSFSKLTEYVKNEDMHKFKHARYWEYRNK